MEATTAPTSRFDHLREHSIGLPQVLFQSITHMAPAAAVAYSIFISVPQSQQALPLSVGLALIACICAATAIGQLAKLFPSAGGMYTYAGKALGPWAGFLVAWLFILFQPLVAPFLYLEFGWAMSDVFSNSIGWHYSGQWWVWVVLMTVIVFLLTYRDIRLSTTAGVILGGFEIAIFAALALWMIFSNAGDLNLQPFNPHHAVGDWSGVFKGMVFAILAFIGFEASAPLGEEARNPRRTVPRAVVGSAIAIGIFYVPLRLRVGVRCRLRQLRQAGDREPRPVAQPRQGLLGRRLGARVSRDLQLDRGQLERGRERRDARLLLARPQRARTAPARAYAQAVQDTDRRDHLDVRVRARRRAAVRLEVGPLNGFFTIATLAVPPVILVYMLVSAGSLYWYWTKARSQFNVVLHLVLPVGGIVLFFFPLYYQFVKYPPVYPEKYGNWVDIAWVILGLALTAFVVFVRPDKLKDIDRVYVEDETIEDRVAASPVA